jgi:hypothetical protein
MRILKSRNVSPESDPPAAAVEGSDRRVWEWLVPRLIHPLQLAIVEALLWVEEPLSVAELVALFSPLESNRELVRYHAKCLVKAGVLEATDVGSAAVDPRDSRFVFPSAPG